MMPRKDSPRWYMSRNTFDGTKSLKRELENELTEYLDQPAGSIEISQDGLSTLILDEKDKILPILIAAELKKREFSNEEEPVEVPV